MRIHRLLSQTEAEGPGVRFCIWAQGCSRGCPGCFAEALQDPAGGEEIGTDEIIRQIASQVGKIRGVTFLGGEPFEQAAALGKIAAFAQNAGLDVITFTGSTLEALRSKPEAALLLNNTDLLIDGPYVQELQDFSRPLAGSKNQRFLFLTRRFSPEEINSYKNRIEVRVRPDGAVQMNGMGDLNRLTDYKNHFI